MSVTESKTTITELNGKPCGPEDLPPDRGDLLWSKDWEKLGYRRVERRFTLLRGPGGHIEDNSGVLTWLLDDPDHEFYIVEVNGTI